MDGDGPTIARLAAGYGRLLDALAALACLIVLAMMLVICVDVLFRNAPLIPGFRGVPGANEITEYALYLVTMLIAPWLLRQGQHIRVDILLKALPRTLAWGMEWIGDLIGLACCLYFVWYGTTVTLASYAAGSISIKTLVLPEWWLLAPMPIAFALFGIEFLFRMHRLAVGERGARDEAVSAA